MNLLVIGNGGREHALVWKLKQSSKVNNIYVATGNPGTASIATNISASSTDEIVDWLKNSANSKDGKIDLVLVAPDNYLAEGLTDKIEELRLGIKVFGPTKAASQIEWSKSFAKEFMKEERIPTAAFETFTDIEKAKNYIRGQKMPLVIKASGLALGKGVVIVENIEQAIMTLEDIMKSKVFGTAGDEVVIEEYLEGREISVHSFCDGETAIMFPAAQDHKRIGEGDKGPNTGGMGTIAPVPWVTEEMLADINNKIVLPTLKALKNRGSPFKGVLFPGIMMTKDGPKVIEFNARFGDPETQSYMRILETDLVDILIACIDGNLSDMQIKWSGNYVCCVVLASGGYPGKYEKGKVISLPEDISISKQDGIIVFHAGTAFRQDNLLTSGGRVLGITATADNLNDTLDKAYKTISHISFEGMQFRKDIGFKSL